MASDHSTAAPGRGSPDGRSGTDWWDHYIASVALPAAAKRVLELDCGYIVDKCLPPPDPDGELWPPSRVRKGLVMGSVQSGKTASMIGVAAKALDRGTDMVVVLAGTRVALWQQTFQRLIDQLDPPDAGGHSAPRVWLPRADGGAEGLPRLRLDRTYTMTRARMRRAVRERMPVIVVAMKQPDHLERLSKEIREHLLPEVQQAGRPFHLLVIDDEADDGSVIDVHGEGRAGSARFKQIPRYVADLWGSRTRPGQTAIPELFSTYVAYTATPQANFLQSGLNPLAPTDFVVALRTPAAQGRIEDRGPTYAERATLLSWYTGGELFYKGLRDAPLCVTTDEIEDPLDAALKAFLVGATVRVWRDSDRLAPAQARDVIFDSREEALDRTTQPSSMLMHPSALKEDHFALAARVLAWGRGVTEPEAAGMLARGERGLDRSVVAQKIHDEPESWRAWLGSYRRTAQALSRECPPLRARTFPGREDWDEFVSLLLDQVLPAVRVAVINSDERADDRPRFEPVRAGGGWRAAPDPATIFVSGSVMSRGLTLDGLLTTFFSRTTGSPLADTQMQMQRWFGYRGSYLELCRVFLSADQLRLFSAYHDADEALRADVLSRMRDSQAPPTPMVLQGRTFAATGKVSGVQALPLCPGPHPFYERVAPVGEQSLLGQELAQLLATGPTRVVGAAGVVRALMVERRLSLLEAADLVDAITLPGCAARPDSWEARRWDSVARSLGLEPRAPEWPLYRAPEDAGATRSDTGSPWALAAYLRLWSAALTRRGPGLFPTEDGRTPWGLLDLADRRRSQPRFTVALRTGRGTPLSRGPLAGLGHDVGATDRLPSAGVLDGGWGSHNQRNGVSSGDEFFDLVVGGEPLPAGASVGSTWRPVGSDGLLLFYLVDDHGEPAVALGASIPLGGPDHVSAVPPRGAKR